MSVPVGLRNVPENEHNAKFDVLESCNNLFYHAVLCCQSSKVQSSCFVFLANGIIQQSLEIYLCAYEANSVPFYKGQITEEQYKTRIQLITQAMRGCSNLEGMVTLGKRSFKWRNNKIYYWLGMIKNTRDLLSNWYKWCNNEFGGREL